MACRRVAYNIHAFSIHSWTRHAPYTMQHSTHDTHTHMLPRVTHDNRASLDATVCAIFNTPARVRSRGSQHSSRPSSPPKASKPCVGLVAAQEREGDDVMRGARKRPVCHDMDMHTARNICDVTRNVTSAEFICVYAPFSSHLGTHLDPDSVDTLLDQLQQHRHHMMLHRR